MFTERGGTKMYVGHIEKFKLFMSLKGKIFEGKIVLFEI